MRRHLAVLVCLVALVATAAPATAAEKPLKVSYNFLAGVVAAGYPFDADPPGANDWSCKPSAAHPRPVVLVHGTAGNKNTNWRTYAPLLRNNGYCVYSFTYGVASPGPFINQLGGMTDIRRSARTMKTFVHRVLASTGARKVDVIGHSQGTILPEYYAKFLGGRKKIRNYVSLAPIWHGTQVAGLGQLAKVFGVPETAFPFCNACLQMGTGSDFMSQVREGGVKLKGIRYTNIMTKYDQIVVPYTSGYEPGMRNFVVQDLCPADLAEHFEIASDPVATVIVLNTLDRKRKQKVPCMPVLPFVGPPA